MFIDSHCHLDRIDLASHQGDFDRLVTKARAAAVDHMLCVCINLDDYPAMLDLVSAYEDISVSVGMHPMAEGELDVPRLRELADDEKVVAIGETGLDYYYLDGPPDSQRDRFEQHISVANEVQKPVIVHTRDAAADTLAILRSAGAEDCGGVIHCFTETKEFASRAMDIGFMISFSGIVTFNNADALREVARYVPDEHILIETDAPYLAPKPYRGEQNQPAYVSRVAETLAEVRSCSLEHIAEVSRQNYMRVFGASIN